MIWVFCGLCVFYLFIFDYDSNTKIMLNQSQNTSWCEKHNFYKHKNVQENIKQHESKKKVIYDTTDN